MMVLLIGSGAREHAMAEAIARSPRCGSLHAAPGNPGIARVARCHAVAADDVDGLVALARELGAELVVVGPELPLVRGLVDRLASRGVAAFGPSAAAARLEGSKGFTKDLCTRAGIPTARYGRFSDLASAERFARAHDDVRVIKADGLAAGKGVVVAADLDETLSALRAMFASPGAEVVLEERLEGPELSMFALCDGARAVSLGTAMDYKRVRDGDEGPNTGGMGAIAPHPLATPALERELLTRFIDPTLDEMRRMGAPFRGVLYLGVMLTARGPRLLEYNVRFGDPECQALLARFDGDLLALLKSAAEGALDVSEIRWRTEASACVVIAAEGYPGAPTTGDAIAGIELATSTGAGVFHAGTRLVDGVLQTAGGRVLSIVARGDDVADAAARARRAAAMISIRGAHWRRDVGSMKA